MPRGQISISQLCKHNYAFLHFHSTVEKGRMYKANAQHRGVLQTHQL